MKIWLCSWHFAPNCNLIIWKQFKTFKPIGFLIIPSNCQAHSCLRAIAFTVPTLWTAVTLDVSRAVPLNPKAGSWVPHPRDNISALHLDITFSAHLPWPPPSSMSCCSFLLYLFIQPFIYFFDQGSNPGPQQWKHQFLTTGHREFPFLLYFLPWHLIAFKLARSLY